MYVLFLMIYLHFIQSPPIRFAEIVCTNFTCYIT